MERTWPAIWAEHEKSFTYPDMQTALREFQTLCGFMLEPDQRCEVAALIEKNGLSRLFVAELAAETHEESLRSFSAPGEHAPQSFPPC